jgi:hypothetical protein
MMRNRRPQEAGIGDVTPPPTMIKQMRKMKRQEQAMQKRKNKR